ncbi:hypothetical protein EON80_11940 [bacterium]|nr:MAG: hypothetical protein EON80_11940 [bacterium]
MNAWLLTLSLLVSTPSAFAADYACVVSSGDIAFTESGSAPEAIKSQISNRCLDMTRDAEACQQATCEQAPAARLGPAAFTDGNKKCDSDSDCKGFANRCFARQCTQPGYGCETDADCPGFANRCFARSCTRQEPLCNSDRDCHGFANRCFAGKCTNP